MGSANTGSGDDPDRILTPVLFRRVEPVRDSQPVRRRRSHTDLPAARSGPQRRPSTDSFILAARAMLVHAMTIHARVTVFLRGDASAGRELRQLEGIPLHISMGADRRERVQIEVVAGETYQVILVERIAHVRIEPI